MVDVPLIESIRSRTLGTYRCVWEIPRGVVPDMQVSPILVTHPTYLTEMVNEVTTRDWQGQSFTPSLVQLCQASCLQGAVGAAGLPDMHTGYGFAIGNMVATAMPNQGYTEGVISPGGIGFDINCGVRVIKTSLSKKDLNAENKQRLAQELFDSTLPGITKKGLVNLKGYSELDDVLTRGMDWAVDRGYAWAEDRFLCEDQGCLRDCSAAFVSARAKKRGIGQLSTLGTGNHYLEVQAVDDIFDSSAAKAYGLHPDQVIIMVHCGSRGIGHQIASEAVCRMEEAMVHEQRSINDPQLSCASISSQVGQEYFLAMNAAANFAFANRSCLTYFIRKAFENVFEQSADALEMSVLYDVSHNIAKREMHMVNGRQMDVMVHRKGATRSFGPNHADIPVEYRAIGQPVLVGGSMGTKSYILKGTEKAMELTFGTTCHGAGRAQSRSSARKKDWNEVIEDLEQKDITFRVNSPKNISEESPEAYKDVNTVVDVCHSVGISEKVARLQPLVVVKG